MNSQLFHLFMLLIFVGLVQTFAFFKHHFSGVDELKTQVAHLEHQIKVEQTKTAIAAHASESLRQEVAALLPGKIQSREDYKIRNLASVLQAQSPIEFDTSSELIEKAKEAFGKTRYQAAVPLLKELIEKHPDSKEIVEAHFLLVESYAQMQLSEDSIDVVEAMVQLFPESELTGFALLRMSGIYFGRHLDEEAIQILQTVKHNFAYNRDLVEQANLLLKKAEL